MRWHALAIILLAAAGAALPFTANDEVIAVGCRVVIIKLAGLAAPPVAGIPEFRLYD